MLWLILLLMLASTSSAAHARKVTGRSGRTYYVKLTPSAPGKPFTTATVLYLIESSDVTLIQYRQYIAPEGKFKTGDRVLSYRAPIAKINAQNDPVGDAEKDFGPFAAKLI